MRCAWRTLCRYREVLPPKRDKRARRKSGENSSNNTAAVVVAQRTFDGARRSRRRQRRLRLFAIMARPSVCRPVCHVWSRVKPSVDHRRLHAAVRLEMLRNSLQTSHGQYTHLWIITNVEKALRKAITTSTRYRFLNRFNILSVQTESVNYVWLTVLL